MEKESLTKSFTLYTEDESNPGKCSTNIRNEFLCFGGKVNLKCSSGFVMHKDRRVSNKLSFLIQQCTAAWAGQWVKMFTFHVVDDAGFSTSFKVSV